MDEIIGNLEAQIQLLVQQNEQLKHIVHCLRHSKAQLARKKKLLLAKHKTAISQIESMVLRLKSIENLR